MKTLYLDLGMGAAGDMLTAALLELFDDPDEAVRRLNGLGIPGVEYRAERCKKSGITGTHVRVTVDGAEEAALLHGHHHEEHDHHHEDHGHSHSHTGLQDIRHLIRDHLRLPEQVKTDALAVYELIADAESRVHGEPVENIHFHEVGTMDAVADVTAVCYLLHLLAPDRICASPVHVGSGTVRCAHGVLPVPAPAAALLLEGVPTFGGEVRGELCTPTGAALLRHFVDDFGSQPLMTTQKIGYGMGTKEFPQANCLRILLGESGDRPTDSVTQLSFNVDDQTAEELAFAMERIYEAGAREVFYVPVTMKKSRPGVLAHVITDEAHKDAVVGAVFRHTSTIGLRMAAVDRCVLQREEVTADTPFGPIRKKISRGYGVTREKYEHDDLARVARERDMSIAEVLRALGEP